MLKEIDMKKLLLNAFLIAGLSALMTGRAVAHIQGGPDDVDLFDGHITNQQLNPKTLFGKIVYDRNCVSVGDGQTNCDAGVKVEGREVLNFNYIHDMSAKSCLISDQKLMLKITSQHKAVVVR